MGGGKGLGVLVVFFKVTVTVYDTDNGCCVTRQPRLEP